MVRLGTLLLLVGLVGCGPSEAEQADACAKGTPRAQGGVTPGSCDYLIDERCFDDQATACLCAGCATDHCAIQESYPAVPVCD